MKKNLMKLAALAVVSVMGASMLAACGEEAPATEPETKQEQNVEKTASDAVETETETPSEAE